MGATKSESAPAQAGRQPARSQSRLTQTAGPALNGPPYLQRQIGNRALGQLLSARAIQPKLSVGPSDDPGEREADHVADMLEKPKPVGALSAHAKSIVQRKCADCPSDNAQPAEALEDQNAPRQVEADELSIQTKANAGGIHSAGGIESRLRSASQGGTQLAPNLRSDMEQHIGADFSNVRIHTDSAAAQMNSDLNALAFTHGSNIYFGEGQYDPNSTHGRRLIAHELAHVVQQGGGAQSKLIQRNGKKKKPAIEYIGFQVFVPDNYTTLEQMYRLFERFAYGREMNHTWDCGGYCDITKARGKVVKFLIPKSNQAKLYDPKRKKEQEESKQQYQRLPGKNKQAINEEVNKRYYKASGDKPGTKIKKGEEGKAQTWDQALDEVMKEKQTLENLPKEIKELLGAETSYKPMDYQHLLKIAEKLKKFSPEDFVVYKLLAIRATDNMDLFEQSVDRFLARKEEIRKALEQQQQQEQQKGAGGKEPTLRESLDEQWKDLDEASIATMSESDRYKLANQKANELTKAHLKYMKDHPGEVAKDFAKSALLLNSKDTFKAIGKDLQEVANGDANTWARWAAGAGAGAKLSGWLMAVASILLVVSFFTGIGELATIGALALGLLAANITLSTIERDLRVKAASQATTSEEFKRNVELAAEAQTNVIVAVGMIALAALLHFAARTVFPNTMKKISTSIKNFRERVRLKGSIYDLKPQITKEMGQHSAELFKAAESMKQQSLAAGEELSKLSTEQFVEKMEKGGGGFTDNSKVPENQRLDFRELMKSPEGRAAIETFRTKLVNSLKTDVLQAIDKFAQEYASKIDEFLKEIDAAKNHDELNAATDKVDGVFTDENVRRFLEGEQERVTKQKTDEAMREIEAEAAKVKAEAEAKAKAEAEAKAKAEAEQKAKAETEAKAKVEEAEAQKWLDELRKTLSETAIKKLDGILKSQKTAKGARDVVQSKGGKDFLEGKTAPPKIVSDPKVLETLNTFENDPVFLNRPAVKKAAAIVDQREATLLVRSELASEIALRRAQAAYASKPGINIYEGVKVLREVPGFKTVADFKAANPGYGGPVFERGGKVYKPVTDIDLLVTQKTGSQPETMLQMEEIKSGELDTPGGAMGQLKNAQKALSDLANGDQQIRLELTDKTDVTSRFDARSASTAKVGTTGPQSAKPWTESLGATAEDLYAVAVEILKKITITK